MQLQPHLQQAEVPAAIVHRCRAAAVVRDGAKQVAAQWEADMRSDHLIQACGMLQTGGRNPTLYLSYPQLPSLIKTLISPAPPLPPCSRHEAQRKGSNDGRHTRRQLHGQEGGVQRTHVRRLQKGGQVVKSRAASFDQLSTVWAPTPHVQQF